MITFNGYKKQYGSHLVLSIPTCHLPIGTYWIKGINGSGKSTLLKSLAGYIPFDGAITINHVAIKQHKRSHRLLVNFGEAAPTFPSFLTGMDLIHFYIETKKGNKETCLQFCTALNLGKDALEKQIGTYSSGMLKKLSLALAFTGQPAWILLDEPLITLDTAAIEVVLHQIATTAAAGVGMLLTSHQDMDFATNNLQLTTLTTTNQTLNLSA